MSILDVVTKWTLEKIDDKYFQKKEIPIEKQVFQLFALLKLYISMANSIADLEDKRYEDEKETMMQYGKGYDKNLMRWRKDHFNETLWVFKKAQKLLDLKVINKKLKIAKWDSGRLSFNLAAVLKKIEIVHLSGIPNPLSLVLKT